MNEFEMQNKRKKYWVSTFEELKKSKCLGVEVNLNDSDIQCFLVYQKNSVYSYLNSCPHTGINLEWTPDQFLDSSNNFIQCSTHGALFDIEKGVCLRGPCVGDHLKIIENKVVEGNIYLIL